MNEKMHHNYEKCVLHMKKTHKKTKKNWQSFLKIKVDKIASGDRIECMRHFERAQKFIRNGFLAKNCVIAYTQ